MCSPFGAFFEPWNIMCSNRCAKPVLLCSSSREPTSYVTATAIVGDAWSGFITTTSPLSSVAFWISSAISSGRSGAAAAFSARGGAGASAAAAPERPLEIALRSKATLDNGLVVVMNPARVADDRRRRDHDVGSRDDSKDNFAHLFEHMTPKNAKSTCTSALASATGVDTRVARARAPGTEGRSHETPTCRVIEEEYRMR